LRDASTLQGFILERPDKYGTEVYSPPRNGRMSESEVFLTKSEKWCSRDVTFAQLVVR